MGMRTKARECAFQMLYQWDLTREPMDRVAGLFWQVRTSTPETRAMAERLARGGQAEVERLDEASGPWRGSAFGKARQAGDHGYQDNGSGQRFHPTRSFGARVSPLANNKAGKNK